MKILLKPKQLIAVLSLIVILMIVGCRNHSVRKDFTKYDPLVWSAMIAYEDQDFEHSLSLFQKAFELIPDDSEYDIFHAAAAALRLNKDDVADKLIRTAISKTNPNENYYNNFQGFTQFKSKQLFTGIEKDYEQLVEQFYSNLSYPKEIEDEILDMLKQDQAIRNSSDEDEISKVDSLNINRLIEITNKYGWIEKGWLLLWHQRGNHREDNYIWNHFRPLIEGEMKNGKIRKSFWAMFDDELSIRDSRTQIYGMYQNQFPVQNVETVDKRRNELGLPPLWYQNKVYGQELPNGYSTQIKDLSSFKQFYSIQK